MLRHLKVINTLILQFFFNIIKVIVENYRVLWRRSAFIRSSSECCCYAECAVMVSTEYQRAATNSMQVPTETPNVKHVVVIITVTSLLLKSASAQSGEYGIGIIHG